MTIARSTGRPEREGHDPRPSGPRRGAGAPAALAALAAGAVLLAGCGSSAPSGAATATPATPAATTASSAPPTPSPTAAATSTVLSAPNTPAPGGQSTATPRPGRSPVGSAEPAPSRELPHDGGEYGDELISAWRAGDRAAVAALTSPKAAAALVGKRVPSGLILTACEDNLCSWSSESGARLTMTFDAAKLADGAGHAVTAVKLA